MARSRESETHRTGSILEWSEVRNRLVTLSEKLDSVQSRRSPSKERESEENEESVRRREKA
jgi:hypothetical protein